MRAQGNSATSLLKTLLDESRDSAYEEDLSEEEFSDDEYYRYTNDSERKAEPEPLVRIEDLRASLSRSVGGVLGGAVQEDELARIEAANAGVMKVADRVIRVPIYVKRGGADVPPQLVLQFDCAPPYPAKLPSMKVVTALEYISEASSGNLISWLEVQYSTKLGKEMLQGLVNLSQMWVEIQYEIEQERLLKVEAKRKKKEQRAAEEAAQMAEEERLEQLQKEREREKREERERRIAAGEDPEEEEESDEEDEDSGEERRHFNSKFVAARCFVPTLSDMCIKVFGDCLLMFEGFEEVPITIRAKVFKYLVDTESLSHRKLALLVGQDARRLDLAKCRRYMKDHYMEVLQRTPELQKLSVRGATHLTDEGFLNIARCGRLTDLNLSKTGVTSKSFFKLVEGCPNLVRLDVSHCESLDIGMYALAKRCDKLTFLYANYCPKLDIPDTLKVLNVAPPLLQVFEIAGLGKSFEPPPVVRWGQRVKTQVVVVEYNALSTPLHSLTSLNMNDCCFLTDHFVSGFFCAVMPRMHRFEHKGTSLTSQGLMHFLSKCPGMTRLVANKWGDTPAEIAGEIKSFQVFLDSAAKANVLREVDVQNCDGVTLEMLAPLEKLQSLQKLHLTSLPHKSLKILKLLPFVASIRGLKILRLSHMPVGKKPSIQSGAMENSHVLHLQLWDMARLTDQLMHQSIIKWMPNLQSLSIRGQCSLTREGLEIIINELTALNSLVVDKETRIAYPLSILFDAPHRAPISSISLFGYELGDLFMLKSLDTILDEGKAPNEKIRMVDLDRGEFRAPPRFRAYDPPTVQHALFFQGLFFFCPFMEKLVLSHQLPNIYLALDLPNNSLKELVVCRRHDCNNFSNPNKLTKLNAFDCDPSKDAYVPDRPRWMRRFDDSSDEDFDIGDLFD